ncbi:MAG: Transglutaminase-like enzyme [Candidatus Ozemobacter sibiricus]|uniref:Transglutaminase-like enzyme n=1 Tax=Candidatus Ozemobacter sibiricus TaxID=2268124 RepID=A0A367ZR35_9BACT|nr:MAG: Transglutaminase-like enzyme [Candidatus Ozemobacter sibiricus]
MAPLWFRSTVLTGMAAVGCFLTTGFGLSLSLGCLGFGLVMAIWGKAPHPRIGWVAQAASLPWLGRAWLQWRAGTPGIVALTEFALGVLALQWLQMHRPAEARRGLILAGMIVLAVAAMSINFLFPLGLAPFVIGLLFTLWGLADRAGRPAAACPMWPALLRGGVIMVALWIGLFYLLPRPDILGLTSGGSKQRLRGFSETLNLGETGPLEDNPMVVMRVRPLEAPERLSRLVPYLQNTLLRGCSFHSYRRGSWSREGYYGRRFNLQEAGGEMILREQPDDPRPEVELEILLEAVDPPLLLVPQQALSLRSSLRHLWIQADGTMSLPARRGGVEVYVTRVKLGPPTLVDDVPRGIEFPPFFRPFLDPGDSSEVIADLASEVASSTTTVLATVLAVERFLQTNFTYSLEETLSGVRDPVSHFLLTERRGSCEHFASAMTLMLRHLGIPARPVNGYLMNEWNEFGGFFTVRQRDAHSWVEVFLPGRGWTAFDPTPPEDRPGAGGAKEVWRSLVAWREWFEGFWFNYVYRFDRDLQLAGFRRLYQAVSQGGKWLGFLVGALLAGSLLSVIRPRLGRPRAAARPGWLPDWYRDLCRMLPLSREPWETPREFHRRLLRAGLVAPEDRPLLDILEREVAAAVFGGDAEGAAARARPAVRDLPARCRRPSAGA